MPVTSNADPMLRPMTVRYSARTPAANAAATTSSSITGPGTRLPSDATRYPWMSIVLLSASVYRRGAVPVESARTASPAAAHSSFWSSSRWRLAAANAAVCRHLVGKVDGGVGVVPQQVERRRSRRLGQELSAQIGGADVVGFLHHERPAVLVPSDGHRQAEREEQADEAKERALDDADRFVVPLGVRPDPFAEHDADCCGTPDDEDEHGDECHRVEAEEHPLSLTVRQPWTRSGVPRNEPAMAMGMGMATA